MAKKMTKAQMFAQIKANYSLTDEEIAFIDHELELLAKKNSSEKKPTATQKANEGIKTAILDNLDANAKYTITDIMKSVPECTDLTNQKVSAIVKQMVDEGTMIRVEEKRKAYFKIA